MRPCAQAVGMLGATKDLPAVQKMLQTAKQILGYDLLEAWPSYPCCAEAAALLFPLPSTWFLLLLLPPAKHQ